MIAPAVPLHALALCPLCEQGTLTAQTREATLAVPGGQVTVAGLTFSVCDTCQGESLDTAQLRGNLARVQAAKVAAGLADEDRGDGVPMPSAVGT
jgi:hypothetical protein